MTVEVSRDGTTMFPICSPMQTSGLTLIKLQLLKSEVVMSVTIRLHKPRDSTTIGLSQVMLLGNTAFGDSGNIRSNNMFVPTEDYVSRTRYVYTFMFLNPIYLVMLGHITRTIWLCNRWPLILFYSVTVPCFHP